MVLMLQLQRLLRLMRMDQVMVVMARVIEL